MAKDETKNGRESQTGSRRTAKTETATSVPLVSAKRGKFTSLRDTKVESVVYAQLSDYKMFVREVEGEEPDEGAIVSAALEMLFEADLGFERWLNDQRKKSRQPTENNSPRADLRSTTAGTGLGSSI